MSFLELYHNTCPLPHELGHKINKCHCKFRMAAILIPGLMDPRRIKQDELGKFRYCHFNWVSSVNPVMVLEVNTINIETLQAILTSCSRIGWVTSNLPLTTFKTDAKSCSQLDSVPYPFNACIKYLNQISKN